MKKIIISVLLLGCLGLFTSCAGGGGGKGVYLHHHGHGPWWGGRDYYHDRVIVVPPEAVEPPLEATTLPSEPEDMPDMGMPEMDFGDFGD